MTNKDEMSLNQVCGLLRAMASNYTTGHCWDHLDGEAVSRAANGIESLLEERDWQAKRIEMLEKYVNDRDEENQGLLLTVGRLHTKLEARTVSVKFPEHIPCPTAPALIWLQTNGDDGAESSWPENSNDVSWCWEKMFHNDTLYVRADLAAGIKLEVDG